MIFNETFKNIKRIREIIQVLVKYGFEDIVTNSTLRNFVSESKRLTWLRRDRPVFDYTSWERIRMAAEELGPTFIKLAQVMSNRPDMLPEELIKEFEKLQNNVPPFKFSIAKAIIERELGKPIEEVFDDFDPKALASASIGQVHRARLKNGEEIVMKIQRPEVGEIVYRDLAILTELVKRADRYLKKQGIMNAVDVVKVFERTMLKEMDYTNEARNIERFRKVYENHTNFYIPKAYKEYTTPKIMVIEMAKGCKISDVEQLIAWGLDPRKIAENGMNVYLTMIFEYGYFHADPHPGNVFVRPDGVICLIDFGMVGQLMPNDKYAFAGIFLAMANQDAREMASNMKKLAVTHEIDDMRAFEYELQELIEDYAYLDVKESSIADMTTSLQKIMYNYRIVAPASIFLIFRAMAILEGIGKTMHPEFKTYEFIKPFGAKLVMERLKPENLFKELTSKYNHISSFLTSFPAEVRGIMQKIGKGKMHFEVELQGYGYLLKKLDSLTNRISLTILIAALIVGSAIVITAGHLPPHAIAPNGLPYISMIGFSIAGFLSLLLFYTIIRRRKYK